MTSKKFQELLDLYNQVQNKDRKERYNQAELHYKEKHGQYLYDDFRKFSAMLSMHYSQSVPHSSSVKGYVNTRQ